MAPAFDINRIQYAMFCQVEMGQKLTLAAALQNSNRSRLDGEPVVLPTPPESPPDIPGFILQSRDGSTTIAVSSTRVDVTVEYEPGTFTNVQDLLEAEEGFILTLSETLANLDPVVSGISRVGVILMLSADLTSVELRDVRDRFLPPNLGLGENRFEVGFLDRQCWPASQVNRWLHFTLAQREDGNASLEIVLDFNTVPQVEGTMDHRSVQEFLETLKPSAVQEMKVFYA